MDKLILRPWLKELLIWAAIFVVGLVGVWLASDKWQPIVVFAFLLNIFIFGRLLQSVTKTRDLRRLELVDLLGALVMFIGGLIGSFIWTGRWHPIQVAEFVVLLVGLGHAFTFAKGQKIQLVRESLTWVFGVCFMVLAEIVLGQSINWIYVLSFATMYIFSNRSQERNMREKTTRTEGTTTVSGIAKF